MDLASVLAEEIKKLNLTDELSIARYIYIRTGELFDYSMSYLMMDFSKPDEIARLEQIKNQEVNIHNIQDFNLVCTSWANLYVDLLTYFGIKAKTMDSEYHSYAIVYLTGYEVIADMMIKYEDIRNIKFGFEPKNFIILYNYAAYLKINEIDQTIKFFKGINPEEVIHKLASELQEESDLNKRFLNVLEAVNLIINIKRPYISFYSGFKYLKKLLNYFMDVTNLNTSLSFFCYANEDLINFKGIISCRFYNEKKYYIYQKEENDFYKLSQIEENDAESLNKAYTRRKEM